MFLFPFGFSNVPKQGGEGTHALGIVEEQQAAIHSFGDVLATVHREGEVVLSVCIELRSATSKLFSRFHDGTEIFHVAAQQKLHRSAPVNQPISAAGKFL